MKKLFYILFVLLLFPVIVNAKEIEIKSITPEETYSDIEVEIKDSSTANINFTIDGTNFTKVAKYNVVINNATDNTYDFEFTNIKNLKNMLVESSQDKLNPGENNITLTITRPDLGADFYTNTTEEDNSSVVIKMTNTNDEENTNTTNKENPKTGYTIVKVVTVSLILISLAIALYAKTKNSSSFFILLLIIFMPSIINAKESFDLKININTTVTKYYTTCVVGDEIPGLIGGYNRSTMSFNYGDFVLNTKEDDLLKLIFDTEEDINKTNILQFINNIEGSEIFEYYLLKTHSEYYDEDKYEYLDVDGETNIVKSYRASKTNNDYTFIYKDDTDTLTVYIVLPNYESIQIGDDSSSYELKNIKITFNKYNDDYTVYTHNNEYNEFGYIVVTNPVLAELVELDSRTVPIINLKKHIEKIKKESGIIDIDEDANTYTINNETITEENIKSYSFDKNYYRYEKLIGDDVYGAIYYKSMKDIRDIDFKYNYIFTYSGDKIYKINSDEIVSLDRMTLNTYTRNCNLNLGNNYLVLLSQTYACYSAMTYD